jgi:hypothetical protein
MGTLQRRSSTTIREAIPDGSKINLLRSLNDEIRNHLHAKEHTVKVAASIVYYDGLDFENISSVFWSCEDFLFTGMGGSIVFPFG